jgi:hypothetical protein
VNQPKPTPSNRALVDPIEIVREYARIQAAEKQLEIDKAEMKKKLGMIIPTDLDAKAFVLPEVPGGRYVARRVQQDRRKPDDSKLVKLLSDLEAPFAAFERKPNHEYVAWMIENGQMTLEQFRSTLSGKLISYVSLTFRKDGEAD